MAETQDNLNGNKVGRPPLTDKDKELLVQKLEPYLKTGISLRKACFQAQIPRSTVYGWMGKDSEFSDKIKLYQQHASVVLADIVFNQLKRIADKSESGKDLGKEDLSFIKWFALNSHLAKDEYGRREAINPFIENPFALK